MLEEAGVKPIQFDSQSLGTIGRGNHFAELHVNVFSSTGGFVAAEKIARVKIHQQFVIRIITP